VKEVNISDGQYFVNVIGHCSECHTPRDVLGVPKFNYFFSGGIIYEKNKVYTPNITPDESGIGKWSETEIANYLRTGFTPDYDSSGGLMAEVIENLQALDDAELLAIAKYLKTIKSVKNSLEK
jgi:mono/diheme cytochrome c family protein